MLTDGHCHIKTVDVLDVLKTNNIFSLVCGMDPDECARIAEWGKDNKHVIPTYGLHPWNAGKISLESMAPYLEECSVIGEIGMDNVWCDVPLDLQEKAFVAQLDIAQRRNVPVILHTKGQESEIADILTRYTMPVLIHWYSCENFLDKYLDKGYYFTIGPSVEQDKNVQAVALAAPIDRILVETDGVEAIEWARGSSAIPSDIPVVLKEIMSSVARLRKMATAELAERVNMNFTRFCKKL